MPKKYSDEFKKQVIAYYDKQHSIIQTAEKYNVAISSVARWINDYTIRGSLEESFTLSEFKTLQRKYERTQHLLEIIKLTKLLDEVELQRRLRILANLYEKTELYSVRELCEALNVDRGTFYNHIFREVDRSKYLEEQSQLMLKVQQIFEDAQQRYGAAKICAVLAQNGINVGKRRVKSIMDELGLESVQRGAKNSYKKEQERLKRNILNREFKAERMNEKWVSDITYFKLKNYPVYLCIILDLFSRKVVGYKVSKKCSTNLVTATFKQAFENRGQPQGLMFHSDRGAQYISDTFRLLLRDCGVTQSFSNSGKPYDNAVIESFFSTFKKEEAYRRNYRSENEFKKLVDEYIMFYNEKRPHSTLAFKSPNRFEEVYGKV
ncbi:MAG: IS3 family transposase [Ruminococcaceae bacterium]|nr:IS3 family transposase [Oscillospiraceae bacterium]